MPKIPRRPEEDEVIDLMEQWVNGNRKDVVDVLISRPRKYTALFAHKLAMSSHCNWYDMIALVTLFDAVETSNPGDSSDAE
jgi:hypothetical protein